MLVAAGLFVAYRLLPVIELVAVAMLVALILRTVVRGMERAQIPTWLAIAVLLAVIGVFAAILWLVVVPNVTREVRILTSALPRFVGALANLADKVAFIPDKSQLPARLQGLFSGLAGALPSLATLLAQFTGAIVAVLFLALYMSLDPDPLVSEALRLVPQRSEIEPGRSSIRSRPGYGAGSSARPPCRCLSEEGEG